MPEHLRALVAILAIALATFWLAAKPMCAVIMATDDYRRRRNAWFGMTLAAFLTGNFWLYVFVSGALAAWYGARDRSPLALYCLLILVIPQDIAHELPGVGPVRYLFLVDHVRVLNLVLLLPLALRLRKTERRESSPQFRLPDLLVIGLILFMVFCEALNASLTGTIRTAFNLGIDIWLPYFVASRALRDSRDFREMAGALVLCCWLVGTLAAYEAMSRWLLYFSLRGELGLQPSFYAVRGVSAIRAQVSATQPIVLGYLLVVGLGMLHYVAPLLRPKSGAWLAGIGATAGLLGSLSRGPWVGAVAMLLANVSLGPARVRRVAMLLGVGGLALTLLLLSPYGQLFLDVLPFIGEIDSGSVDYRVQLFDVSIEVFRQNIWLGDVNFLGNPLLEQMRQGQGIIDMVNTFLQIALGYGVVGVTLFCGAFLAAFRAVWRVRRLRLDDAEVERLGRTLLVTLVGILVMIATVSGIGVVPTVYWLIIGASIGYSRAFAAEPLRAIRSPTVRTRAIGALGVGHDPSATRQ